MVKMHLIWYIFSFGLAVKRISNKPAYVTNIYYIILQDWFDSKKGVKHFLYVCIWKYCNWTHQNDGCFLLLLQTHLIAGKKPKNSLHSCEPHAILIPSKYRTITNNLNWHEWWIWKIAMILLRIFKFISTTQISDI